MIHLDSSLDVTVLLRRTMPSQWYAAHESLPNYLTVNQRCSPLNSSSFLRPSEAVSPKGETGYMPLFPHSQTLKLFFLKKLYLSYFPHLKLAETMLDAHQHNVERRTKSPKTDHNAIGHEVQATIITYIALLLRHYYCDCAFWLILLVQIGIIAP